MSQATAATTPEPPGAHPTPAAPSPARPADRTPGQPSRRADDPDPHRLAVAGDFEAVDATPSAVRPAGPPGEPKPVGPVLIGKRSANAPTSAPTPAPKAVAPSPSAPTPAPDAKLPPVPATRAEPATPGALGRLAAPLGAPLARVSPRMRQVIGLLSINTAFLALCVWAYALFFKGDGSAGHAPGAAHAPAAEHAPAAHGAEAKKPAAHAKKPEAKKPAAKKDSHGGH